MKPNKLTRNQKETTTGASRDGSDHAERAAASSTSNLGGTVQECATLTHTLSAGEAQQLEQCEAVLSQGLGVFFEVGRALLAIREGRLYRATHATFETYCHERWGIGRSYASRVIGAAKLMKTLPPNSNLPVPTNEFQIRPCLKVEPDQFPRIWEETIRRAKEGRVTAHLVQMVIDELTEHHGHPVNGHEVRPATRTRLPLGRILTLLTGAKKNLERDQKEEAIAALETIEDLLFSTPRNFGA